MVQGGNEAQRADTEVPPLTIIDWYQEHTNHKLRKKKSKENIIITK